MPYKRNRRNRKRTYRRRRRYRGSGKSTRKMAMIAYRRIARAEVKEKQEEFNFTFSDGGIAGGAIGFINISRGTAHQDRIADRIRVIGFGLRIYGAIDNTSSGTETCMNRIAVVVQKNFNNGATVPVYNDIYEAADPLSYQEHDHTDNVRMVKTFDFDLIGHPENPKYTFRRQFYKKMNMGVTFSGNNGDHTDVETNLLFMVANNTIAAASNDTTACVAVYRIWWVDY